LAVLAEFTGKVLAGEDAIRVLPKRRTASFYIEGDVVLLQGTMMFSFHGLGDLVSHNLD
jgi:hypothetical protein